MRKESEAASISDQQASVASTGVKALIPVGKIPFVEGHGSLSFLGFE